MADARSKELGFFRSMPCYSNLKNVGTGFLSVKLSNHLIGAIRKQLPVITHSINEGIVNLEKELESMGGAQVPAWRMRTHLCYLHMIERMCPPLWAALWCQAHMCVLPQLLCMLHKSSRLLMHGTGRCLHPFSHRKGK